MPDRKKLHSMAFRDATPVVFWRDAASKGGGKVAIGDSGGTVRVFELETKTARTLAGGKHDAAIHSLAFSPDGQLLGTASSDWTARIWDVKSGGQKAVIKGHQRSVRRIQFSADGRRIATNSDDGTFRIWDVPPRIGKK